MSAARHVRRTASANAVPWPQTESGVGLELELGVQKRVLRAGSAKFPLYMRDRGGRPEIGAAHEPKKIAFPPRRQATHVVSSLFICLILLARIDPRCGQRSEAVDVSSSAS